MTELLFNEQNLPLLFETSETKEQCTMVKAWMSVATWSAVHFQDVLLTTKIQLIQQIYTSSLKQASLVLRP
jgi:hypothetical protein